MQAAAELTDGDPALGIEPRAVRPLERLARHTQDARRCDALQHREVGVAGFHVVQRRDIRILRQQGGLQPAHRNFAGRTPFPGGDGRQRPCRLSREQDYRLQACRTVDKVRNRYGLVRNHQVVRPGRDHHPHRHRKRRHGREGYLPDLRTAIVMVVDGIVADRNARTVKCRRAAVTIRHVIERHADHPVQAPPLAVVRQVCQSVRGAELVIGDPQVAETQFVLDIVDEPQGLLAGGAQRGVTPGIGHLDDIHVDVVAVDRPVEHVFAIGQAAVVEHRLRRNRLPRSGLAGRSELRRVVPFGAGDGLVGTLAVILEDGDESQVLHDVVRLGRRQRLARVGTGVHPDAVGRAAHGQRIAQVGGIDRNACRDLEPVAPAMRETGARHAVAALVYLIEHIPVQDFEPRLGRSHRPEDAVRHVGLEERVAHPARGKRFGPAVMGAQSLAKFVPQPRGQVVVTVGSRDTLRREHPPEHGRGFDDQRGRPLTRRGDGRRSARSRAADNQHVDRAAYRFGLCGTYVRDCEGQHRRK